jgi:hypothetical protein
VSPRIGALAAALLLAAAGGCGGGDDETTGTTAPLAAATTVGATTAAETRPEAPEDQGRWARQVDAACEPWQAKLDAVAPPAGATDLDRWLGETLPLVRRQVAAVEAVKPPAKTSEAERATLFVAGLRKVESGLTRYRAALRDGDPEAVQQALAEANAAGTETRGYALSLAVTQCGGYSGG